MIVPGNALRGGKLGEKTIIPVIPNESTHKDCTNNFSRFTASFFKAPSFNINSERKL